MPRRYYLRSRPPMIGTHPAGATEKEAWYPSRPIPGEATGFYVWGWVEYDSPLSLEQIWQYELLPGNPVEQAEYAFYREGNRVPDEVEWLKGDYLDCSLEFLDKNTKSESPLGCLYRAALVLKER